MTTVVFYPPNTICCDSRVTCGSQIESDNYSKYQEVKLNGKRTRFWIAGSLSDIQNFVEAYALSETRDRELECEAFVFEKGTLYHVQIDEEDIHKTVIDRSEHTAIGSGSPYALTAMDLGCNAREAVKMAARRDSCTGGRIRIYKI